MMTKKVLSIAIFVFLVITSLPGAVKQVRVTADRASIFIEPNRNSTRIEIVEKGMVLALLQQKKVKNIWYYITFSSPRYGTKISGFIMDSMVELVGEEAQAPAKIEEPAPLEPQPKPPQEKPAAEKPPTPQIVKEAPADRKPAPAVEETLVFTALPKAKSFGLPGKEGERQEMSWKPVIPPVEEIAAEKPAPVPTAPQEKPLQPIEVKKEQPKIEEAKKEKEPQILPPPKPPAASVPSKPIRKEFAPRKRGSITLGLGYGSSVGGAGGFLQLNTKAGLSFHAGIGYYPTTFIYSETDWVKNEILFSAGIKYYLPVKSSSFSPYLDLQYGGLRIEAAQVVINIGTIPYVLSSDQKALYGPSILAGAELQWGRVGLNAAAGASYNTTKWDILEQDLFLAFDLSLVVHF